MINFINNRFKKFLILKDERNNDYIAIYEGTNNVNNKNNKNKVIFTFIQINLDDAEDIIENFKNIPSKPTDERFGDLKLYRQNDVKRYRTSKNLTDLLPFLNLRKF